MKYLIIIFFVLPTLCLSQNTRFLYHYQFIEDTLKRNALTNEMVVLDFYGKEKKSVYTSLKHIISDSTMTAKFKMGITTFPDTSTKVRYVIEKNNIEKTMYFYTPNHMSDPVLKVTDARKLKWNISSEKDSILGYAVQKATLDFSGRHWTAWYTNEIPISDGPYKFHGLPGLILKVSDDTNSHSFEIVSINKNKSDYFVLDDKTYEKTKPTSLSAYSEMVEEERRSPLATFRNKAFTGEMYFHSNEEKQRFLRHVDNQIKEIKIHDNNPIEKYYK